MQDFSCVPELRICPQLMSANYSATSSPHKVSAPLQSVQNVCHWHTAPTNSKADIPLLHSIGFEICSILLHQIFLYQIFNYSEIQRTLFCLKGDNQPVSHINMIRLIRFYFFYCCSRILLPVHHPFVLPIDFLSFFSGEKCKIRIHDTITF